MDLAVTCIALVIEADEMILRLTRTQKHMEDLDRIIQRLYDDVLGKLSVLRFQKLSAQYKTEQVEIQQLADRYSDLQELNASTVNELIEKIVVHSPEKSVRRNMSRLKSILPMWGKSGFHLQNRNY